MGTPADVSALLVGDLRWRPGLCKLWYAEDESPDGGWLTVALIMYAMSDCPVSLRASRELRRRGVAFEERLVDEDELWQDEVLRLTDQNTVPVFVHDGGRVEVGFEGEKG